MDLRYIETRKIFGGRYQLDYDWKNHLYYIDKKLQDSVTHILQVLPKQWLTRWAAKMTAEFAIDVFNQSINEYPDYRLAAFPINDVMKEAKKQHEVRKNEAADIGTMIHIWLSRYIRHHIRINLKKQNPNQEFHGEDLDTIMNTMPNNDTAIKCIKIALELFSRLNIIWISSERRVYSPKYGYCGTCDAEAIVNGRLVLIDFKTSNNMESSYALQTAAYEQAIWEEFNVKHHGRLIFRFDKYKTFDLDKKIGSSKKMTPYVRTSLFYEPPERIITPESLDFLETMTPNDFNSL